MRCSLACASFFAWHAFFLAVFLLRAPSEELLESRRLAFAALRAFNAERRAADEPDDDEELLDPLPDDVEELLELDRGLFRLRTDAAAFLDSIFACNSNSFWISARFFSRMSGSTSSSATLSGLAAALKLALVVLIL